MSETYCSWVQHQHARRLLCLLPLFLNIDLLIVLGKVHDLNNKTKRLVCKLTCFLYQLATVVGPVEWFNTETAAEVLKSLDLKFI